MYSSPSIDPNRFVGGVSAAYYDSLQKDPRQPMYNKAVQISRDNGDDHSREIFTRLLKDEEEHVDWLEAQLHQIKEMGYERYLSNQTEGPKD